MISPEEINNLANLARLKLDEAQKAALGQDLENILGYVDQLKEAGELKRGGEVESHLASNVMREDKDAHEPGQFPKLVEVAPKHNGEYVRVKKII